MIIVIISDEDMLKFRTSEMLDKWSPTSKLPDIKLFHYPIVDIFFHLYNNSPVRHTY